MEKRFRQFGVWVADDEQDKYLSVEQVVSVLNEQQANISALKEENEQLQKKYDNLYSAIEKTARDMAEKRIYEMEDFDVFQRITDYVEELDDD